MNCFPFTLHWRNLGAQQYPGLFFFRKTRSGKSTDYRNVMRRFPKAPFLKCFPSKRKRKADVFKSLGFEECLQKALFSWRISVDGNPDYRNNAVFSNFSGEVWTLLYMKLPCKRFCACCSDSHSLAQSCGCKHNWRRRIKIAKQCAYLARTVPSCRYLK